MFSHYNRFLWPTREGKAQPEILTAVKVKDPPTHNHSYNEIPDVKRQEVSENQDCDYTLLYTKIRHFK